MPARHYVVSPQGGGPLALAGKTMAAAFYGAPYSQSMATQASAGIPAYAFVQPSQSGPNTFVTSTLGLVTGTPNIPDVQIMDDGTYIVDENGNILVT